MANFHLKDSSPARPSQHIRVTRKRVTVCALVCLGLWLVLFYFTKVELPVPIFPGEAPGFFWAFSAFHVLPVTARLVIAYWMEDSAQRVETALMSIVVGVVGIGLSLGTSFGAFEWMLFSGLIRIRFQLVGTPPPEPLDAWEIAAGVLFWSCMFLVPAFVYWHTWPKVGSPGVWFFTDR